MTAINASEEAYRMILKRKREMEEEQQGLITISRALDALLGVNEVVGKDELK